MVAQSLKNDNGVLEGTYQMTCIFFYDIGRRTILPTANSAAAGTSTKIASDVGESGKIISELQAILDDVSKHPQTP
ncbi:hypothetical protein SDC9_68492 [bioreactor metagenome]|jgi:hypothetical protein|uniref:Uncharacterized protein n=1 Tax=bioreactor metagenome TaxID=1076179 RepID=A0A644Y0J9_9ZZZZ